MATRGCVERGNTELLYIVCRVSDWDGAKVIQINVSKTAQQVELLAAPVGWLSLSSGTHTKVEAEN